MTGENGKQGIREEDDPQKTHDITTEFDRAVKEAERAVKKK